MSPILAIMLCLWGPQRLSARGHATMHADPVSVKGAAGERAVMRVINHANPVQSLPEGDGVGGAGAVPPVHDSLLALSQRRRHATPSC